MAGPLYNGDLYRTVDVNIFVIAKRLEIIVSIFKR